MFLLCVAPKKNFQSLMNTIWHSLTRSRHDLDLSLTLPAGQVFCWEFDPSSETWVGVIGEIAFRLKHRKDEFEGVDFQFACSNDSVDLNHAKEILDEFFQLEIDLPTLLKDWASRCSIFDRVVLASQLAKGLRICRQYPFECLVSFIVSANNHIKRINSNLKSIRETFGKTIPASSDLWGIQTFCFPSVSQLSAATEDQLRGLGLGYRAGYIVKTCRILLESTSSLSDFRKTDDLVSARAFLTTLAGVGRKVADCVCLYSLDFASVAPVDTHMYQVAQRLFKHVPKDKNMHDRIQELMIERFGEKAGWAHCFLFAADLPAFGTDWSSKRTRE